MLGLWSTLESEKSKNLKNWVRIFCSFSGIIITSHQRHHFIYPPHQHQIHFNINWRVIYDTGTYCHQGGTKCWSVAATLHENLSFGRKSWPPTYAVLSQNQLCCKLRVLIVWFSWPTTYTVLSRNHLCCELRTGFLSEIFVCDFHLRFSSEIFFLN